MARNKANKPRLFVLTGRFNGHHLYNLNVGFLTVLKLLLSMGYGETVHIKKRVRNGA